MPFVKHSDAVDGGNGAASNAHTFIDDKLIPFITSSTHFPVAADRWVDERTDVVTTNEEERFISPPSNAPNAPAVAWHTRADASYMFAGSSHVGGVQAYALPGNTRQFPGDGSPTNPEWDPSLNSDRKNCSWSNVWPTTGLTAHWLFAPSNGKYCYAVIQLSTRRFRHIMFGEFDKFSTLMTGGEFFGAMQWNQSVGEIDDPFNVSRPHSGAIIAQSTTLGKGIQTGAFRALGLRTGAGVGDTAEWHFNGRGGSAGVPTSHNPRDSILRPTGGTWDSANNSTIDIGRSWVDALGHGDPGGGYLFQIQQSLIANGKPLLPLTIWCLGFAEGQDRYMPVGQMPDIFRIHMSGFTPGQDLVVGSDTYSLFPIVNSDQINTVSDDEYSAFDGIAIRQTP